MVTFNKNFKSFIVAALLFISASTMPYKAAGILPYAINENGEVELLLGLSSIHGNQASDFGGLRDESDCNDSKITAAREACEELLFVFDNDEQFKRLLELRHAFGKNFDIVKARSQSFEILINRLYDAKNIYSTSWDNYVMYFVQIPHYASLSQIFDKRKQAYCNQLPHCWNETSQYSWIKLSDIKKAISQRGKSGAPIKINNVYLYEPFVQSLITAYHNGIISEIK